MRNRGTRLFAPSEPPVHPSGWTLLEVAITVVVVLVLFWLVINGLLYRREIERTANCQNRQRLLGNKLSADLQGRLPPLETESSNWVLQALSDSTTLTSDPENRIPELLC